MNRKNAMMNVRINSKTEDLIYYLSNNLYLGISDENVNKALNYLYYYHDEGLRNSYEVDALLYDGKVYYNINEIIDLFNNSFRKTDTILNFGVQRALNILEENRNVFTNEYKLKLMC